MWALNTNTQSLYGGDREVIFENVEFLNKLLWFRQSRPWWCLFTLPQCALTGTMSHFRAHIKAFPWERVCLEANVCALRGRERKMRSRSGWAVAMQMAPSERVLLQEYHSSVCFSFVLPAGSSRGSRLGTSRDACLSPWGISPICKSPHCTRSLWSLCIMCMSELNRLKSSFSNC